MIQITPHMRILLAVEPVDLHAGIDALAGICRQRLQADPYIGTLFVFANRRRPAVPVLVHDGQGSWLCTKRLSSGRSARWPSAHPSATPLLACQLQALPIERRAELAAVARLGLCRGVQRRCRRELLEVVPRQPLRAAGLHALGMDLQRLQVFERVGLARHAGVDQAHVHVADRGALVFSK